MTVTSEATDVAVLRLPRSAATALKLVLGERAVTARRSLHAPVRRRRNAVVGRRSLTLAHRQCQRVTHKRVISPRACPVRRRGRWGYGRIRWQGRRGARATGTANAATRRSWAPFR